MAHRQTASRRKFLLTAAKVFGAGAAAVGSVMLYNRFLSLEPLDKISPVLNPAFRIRRVSDHEIDLYTHLPDGKIISHRFTDLEAQFLDELAKGTELTSLISKLAEENHMEELTCCRKLIPSIRDFQTAGIFYDKQKASVRIRQVRYENRISS